MFHSLNFTVDIIKPFKYTKVYYRQFIIFLEKGGCMFDKTRYFQQAEKILQLNKNLAIEDFIKLYDMANSYENYSNRDCAELADKIISYTFSNGVSSEIMIPWSFFNTDLGLVILKAKYGYSNMPYFISDIVELTGFSKQYIAREASKGNIKGIKKDGTWIFAPDDVNEYLEKKGIKKISYNPTNENIIYPGYERQAGYLSENQNEE